MFKTPTDNLSPTLLDRERRSCASGALRKWKRGIFCLTPYQASDLNPEKGSASHREPVVCFDAHPRSSCPYMGRG